MCEIPDVPGQIVVDEAYAQYAGVDALDRLDERHHHPAHVLQGVWSRRSPRRVRPREAELIEAISSRQAPLSVSSLSAALALTALSSPLDISAALDERDRLAEELSKRRALHAASLVHELPLHSDGRAREAWSISC